jgi:transcriptional regulator with XRE-family HTH domain
MADEPKSRKERVQEALQEWGVKQLDLAKQLQLSEPTISRILAGTYRMHDVRSRRTVVRVLRLVSEKTGLPLEELAAERGIDNDMLTRVQRGLDAMAAMAAAAPAA